MEGREVMRKWLKKLRKNKELSQYETAKRIGICQQYYAFIESGKRQKDLSLILAKKLSLLFDVSLEYIISEEEKTGENCVCKFTDTAKRFVPEDGNGVCNQYAESVSNISRM